jgi:hypothetical protein
MQVGEMLALLIVAVHDEQFSHKRTTRSTPVPQDTLVSLSRKCACVKRRVR